MGSLGGTRLYTVAVACLYLSRENVIFRTYAFFHDNGRITHCRVFAWVFLQGFKPRLHGGCVSPNFFRVFRVNREMR